MQHSVATSEFPTTTNGLAVARSTESVELTDGQQFDLHISPVTKRFGDRDVRMLAYNGSIPDPPPGSAGIDARVNVTNGGDLEATVHWHGLRLDNRYDGTMATQQPIPVGGTFTYRLSSLILVCIGITRTFARTTARRWASTAPSSLFPRTRTTGQAVNRELSVTLDDLLLEGGTVAPFDTSRPTYTAMGRSGNTMLVNGEPELPLCVEKGEVVRFYLTNTANTRVFNVALRGARMKLVGGDSGRYERETLVESVVIAPSERMIVDVLFETAGQVSLEHRTPNRTYQLATITVDDKRAEPWLANEFADLRINADLAAERLRLASYITAEPDRTLALVAEMDMGEPQLSPGATLTYVCPMHPNVTSAEPGKCPSAA